MRVYEKTARLPGFRFCGNVEIGADLTREQLAAAFVASYSGHPDHADDAFDLSVDGVVVVGNATSRSTSRGCLP